MKIANLTRGNRERDKTEISSLGLAEREGSRGGASRGLDCFQKAQPEGEGLE